MSVGHRLRELLRLLTRRKTPVVFGDSLRVAPVGRRFGLDRGQSIQRYYIEQFLQRHAADIQGRVLEVAESTYTRRFGGDRVTQCDVLHVSGHECPAATLIGDLTRPEGLPAEFADCFICTQVLNFIFDVPAAIDGVRRLLKPGGIVLATVSGISQVSRYDMDRWGEYWHFTDASVRRLFEARFPSDLTVSSHGNCLAAMTLLQGLAVQDLPSPDLLDEADPDYPVLVTVRARRTP